MIYPDENRRAQQTEELRRLCRQVERTITVDRVSEDVIEGMRREAQRDVTREDER